jgi:sulfur carrier protein
MKVVVNGTLEDLPEGATVADAVDQVLPPPGNDRARAGMAVALNGEVVLRGDWETIRLSPDDRVEVLAPIQGG